jgi:CRP/FNR family transcriptional regulator/CRP/FNR family cyclic AMP-dependent transcriptional regulator
MSLIRSSQKEDLLKKVPLFNNLSKRHLKEIGKHADQEQVEAGKVLAEQGEKGWEFIFIVEGKARVKKDGKVIRQLSGGDFFGEISLIDGKPRTASVTAETDMTALIVHKPSFDHLLNTIPGLQEKILISLCDYLRKAEKLFSDLSGYTAMMERLDPEEVKELQAIL